MNERAAAAPRGGGKVKAGELPTALNEPYLEREEEERCQQLNTYEVESHVGTEVDLEEVRDSEVVVEPSRGLLVLA